MQWPKYVNDSEISVARGQCRGICLLAGKYGFSIPACTLKFILIIYFLLAQSRTGNAQSSVLAIGEWYKIGILQAGVYKLTVADLQRMGLNPATVNPQHIRIYGNGGAMLPQANAAFRAVDLVENSILVEGETDGRFEAADYVLFYAQGPHVLRYDSVTRRLAHQTNIYSDTAYYFLTVGTVPGKRITDRPLLSGATHEISTFDDYVFHEKEQFNILASGREWWGERFDAQTEQSFTFDLPGMVTSQPARVAVSVMAQSAGPSQFTVKAAGQTVGSLTMTPVTSGTYDLKGTVNTQDFTFTPARSPLLITLGYTRTTGVGYLNWLGVQATRELRLYGEQTTFRSLTSFDHSLLRYIIGTTGSPVQVWDISEILFPAKQLLAVNTTQQTVNFTAEGRRWKEFVIFNPQAGLLKPVSVQRIANQNLRGLPVPELIMITHPALVPEAQRLADFRRTRDGLRVAVVTTQQIYNEFASGRQDITAIRDFLRFLYGQNADLQYVLLFGDASYDYKNRLPGNTNFVPVYESYQSLHPIFSYSSDDYYGFMETGEGNWAETGPGDHTLEVGIGRLPVKSLREARDVVDKLIRYADSPAALGNWRQMVAFVADDGDGNTHQLDADRLANSIASRYKTYTPQKLFLDAFPQISFANGQQSPQMEAAINQTIDRGCLIMNYTGHGSETGWAQEQILTTAGISSWRNLNRLPLMVTATCEFGRYDNPERVSGAEMAFLKANGGAIGLLTTTRPVFSSTNYAVNVAFYNSVFEPVNGQMPRLGDVMKYTKNNSLSGSINRNFALLGDPSMRLAYPVQQAVVTRINDKPFGREPDTLKALRRITLEGEIRNQAGNLLADFNGKLETTVLDKPSRSSTLGTESARMNFAEQNTILFRGKTSVRNGRFRVSFVVPKDINYQSGEGRVSLYAQQDVVKMDAAGAAPVLVGGSERNPVADNEPPLIRLFMDDTTFVSGGRTSPNPVLITRLSDDHGINISRAGIGHELRAVLDDSVSVILNEFFIASTDTYQQGEARFSFKDLTPGKHRLWLQAWDTHNNAAEATLEFIVEPDPFRLRNLYNYPNPVTESTLFTFEHNRPGEDLSVEIQIYTYKGQLINTLREVIPFAPAKINTIEWNLTTDNANKIFNGVYFYRVTVRSIAGSTSLTQKMLIMR